MPDGDDEVRLRAAINWLCRAQDATGSGGVSGGYYFGDGWRPPYPETTGYIICTFVDYGERCGDSRYLERAERMADWEIEIQLESGAVRGGMGISDYPIVFNTGQVILGWLALHRRLGESRFLEAARRAGDWLLSVQDDDGKWSRHTYLDHAHAYHSRVAWPLLELASSTGRSEYHGAAERNVAWIMAQGREGGWFDGMGFTATEPPLTHTIAYTLRGLLESASHFDSEMASAIRERVVTAVETIMSRFERSKPDPYGRPPFLTARFDSHWRAATDYSCLTGNSQLAIIMLKLYRLEDDARFLNTALKLIDQVKATQDLQSGNDGIRGGITGSFPIWGRYAPYAYPNWAAKFFVDAIMLQEEVMAVLEKKLP